MKAAFCICILILVVLVCGCTEDDIKNGDTYVISSQNQTIVSPIVPIDGINDWIGGNLTTYNMITKKSDGSYRIKYSPILATKIIKDSDEKLANITESIPGYEITCTYPVKSNPCIPPASKYVIHIPKDALVYTTSQ